jgi:glycosyltransferase involved in cell wall biosynthesis
MREVWTHVPDAELVLLGADNPWRGGRMTDYLRELAGPFEPRMHLLGRQSPEHLLPALARADVVALPSLWENFATAALEAMALGVAMIVTSGTGFDEFISPEREALMVPRGDVGATAAALVRLLGDPALRAELGEGAASAAARFDVGVVARQTAGALRALTGAGESSQANAAGAETR